MKKEITKLGQVAVFLLILLKFFFSGDFDWLDPVEVQWHDTHLVVFPLQIIIPAISLLAYLFYFIRAAWFRFEKPVANKALFIANLAFCLLTGSIYFYFGAVNIGFFNIILGLLFTSICTLFLVGLKIKSE